MSGEMLDHGTHPTGLVSTHGSLGVFGDLLGSPLNERSPMAPSGSPSVTSASERSRW